MIDTRRDELRKRRRDVVHETFHRVARQALQVRLAADHALVCKLSEREGQLAPWALDFLEVVATRVEDSATTLSREQRKRASALLLQY
jgi:hypothetical protein